MTPRQRQGLSILAGGLLALPFFPFCPSLFTTVFPFLGSLSLLVLFSGCSPKQSFRYGWLVGTVFFGLGASWVYVSIHTFGDVPWLEAGAITFAFVAGLGVFFGLWGWGLNRLYRPRTGRYALLGFPALGTLLEMLKGWVFTGFPWLDVGTSQWHGPLAGFFPIVGHYGVSFLVFFLAGLAMYGVQSRRGWLLLVLALTLLIGEGLRIPTWTHPAGRPLTATLVQGNIPQSLKWDEGNVLLSLQAYASLSQTTPESDLVVWPETAVPLSQFQAADYLDQLRTWLHTDRPHTSLITGLPLFEPATQTYVNAAIALGQGKGSYVKRHLVPFGEYIPLQSVFGPFFEFLQIPMSDLARGPAAQPLIHAGTWPVATFICYESAYSDLVRRSAQNAALLVVLSDDAWFGHSAGPFQHLELNQIRALENGRYLLSVSNNGLTAIVNPKGEITRQLPPFERASLQGFILPMEGKTPFEHWGIWPVLFGCLISLGFSRLLRPRRGKARFRCFKLRG